MSTPFQNRLVGTIIVAAAVVIFLPDILDGEKESYQADFDAIPTAPEFTGGKEHKGFPKEKLLEMPKESLVDEEPIDDALNAPADAQANTGNSSNTEIANTGDSGANLSEGANGSASTANSSERNREDAQAVSSPVTSPVQSVAEQDKYAWVIHLGSFKHQKNVDELMKKLKANGYTAFTQPIKTQKGTLTKVIVGPSLSKSELTGQISALKSLTKVQGRIARFKVTK